MCIDPTHVPAGLAVLSTRLEKTMTPEQLQAIRERLNSFPANSWPSIQPDSACLLSEISRLRAALTATLTATLTDLEAACEEKERSGMEPGIISAAVTANRDRLRKALE